MFPRFSLLATLVLSLSLTSFAQGYYSTTEEPYPTTTEEPTPTSEPTPPSNGCWEDTVPFCCPDCLKMGPYSPCPNPVFVENVFNCTVDVYPEGWACCGVWVNGSTVGSSVKFLVVNFVLSCLPSLPLSYGQR